MIEKAISNELKFEYSDVIPKAFGMKACVPGTDSSITSGADYNLQFILDFVFYTKFLVT